MAGPNIVVVGGGGGVSVLAADELDAVGLKVPALLPETQEALAKVTAEAGTSIRNPIDTMSMWDERNFEATLMPAAKAPNIDAVLYHTSYGMGPGGRMGDPRDRMRGQAAGLRKVQEESGKPVIVAIRSSTTAESFQYSLDFQDICWQNELATYPSIDRAARGMANLLRWQSMHEG
jgi:acyl-CoA synthetase (NDP forming)